jgi:hypothetical protein
MTQEEMNEIEFLKTNVVKPMIDALDERIKPLTAAKDDHETRLAKLEGNQTKALTGYSAAVSVLSAGAAIVVAHAKDWFSRKTGAK